MIKLETYLLKANKSSHTTWSVCHHGSLYISVRFVSLRNSSFTKMKVICAGFGKTGTKSVQAALKELGYNVYDYMENFEYLYEDWMKIFKDGGTKEDFRRMFENVDAVTDAPAFYFWDEIHKAFPEAKVSQL